MTPNERKTLHLEGTVENVLYCNPDNGYTVLELDADGTLVTVVGEMGETEEGERLSVDGEYTTHPRFGMQFRAQYWERKLPADAFNIQRYLSSGAIKGIGPSLAKKIVENFGDRTLEIMEKEPTRLLEIRGISPKKCEAIAAEVRQIFSLRTLMLFLSQYDIRSKYAMRAYQHWGTGAMDMLAANPYLLCSSGVELDFQKADAVAQGMQFAHNAPQRIQAGICYILQYNTNGGNAACRWIGSVLRRASICRSTRRNLKLPMRQHWKTTPSTSTKRTDGILSIWRTTTLRNAISPTASVWYRTSVHRKIRRSSKK